MSLQEKTKEYVSFSITGQYLTNLAREQVLSENWQFAVKFLKEDLLKDNGEPALTYEQIIQILKGDKKIVGESNSQEQTLKVVEDNDLKYKQDINYIYSAIYNDGNGNYYQPYAEVTSWGREDLTNDVKNNNMDKHGNEVVRLFSKRTFWHDSIHYSDTPESDICLVQDFSTILFKKIQTPPFWIKNYKNISKAYENIDPKIRLQERGWMQKYGIYENYDRNSPTRPKLTKTKPTQSNNVKTDEERAETYRKKILKQNQDQWIEISVPDICNEYYTVIKNGILRVPKAPFEQWTLWRTSGSHLATEWKIISPKSLRSGCDPVHTDWMIGAGLPLNAFQEPEEAAQSLKDAVYDKMFKLQEEKLGFECAVLSGHKIVSGTIVYPEKGQKVEKDQIAVIPSAHPDYLDTVLSAAGTITERGGKLCHLALVGKEQSACLVQKEKARQLYPEGAEVTIFPSSGKIKISSMSVRGLI